MIMPIHYYSLVEHHRLVMRPTTFSAYCHSNFFSALLRADGSLVIFPMADVIYTTISP